MAPPNFDLQIARAELEKARLISLAFQRHYERLVRLQEKMPEAVSGDEMDQSEASWKEAQQEVIIAQAKLDKVCGHAA